MLAREPPTTLLRHEFGLGQNAVAIGVAPVEHLLGGRLAFGRTEDAVAIAVHLLE